MRSLQGAQGPQAQHLSLICLQDRPQAGGTFVTVFSCLYVQSYRKAEASSGSSGLQMNTICISLFLHPNENHENPHWDASVPWVWLCTNSKPTKNKHPGTFALWQISSQFPVSTLGFFFSKTMGYHTHMFAKTTFNYKPKQQRILVMQTRWHGADSTLPVFVLLLIFCTYSYFNSKDSSSTLHQQTDYKAIW